MISVSVYYTNMKIIERSYKLLEATERALASLAHEAGEARDYDQAARLIELARDVQQLAVQYGSQRALPSSASSNAQGSVSMADRIVAKQPDVNRKRGRLGQYPKFLRDGDALVKIGWSKSAKNEYEHKSPKRVLTALVTAIMKAGSNGKRFAMESLIPLKDASDGSLLPDYQTYVCLAWLRSLGLVMQHGRQGYSLPKGTPIEQAAERAWTSLAAR